MRKKPTISEVFKSVMPKNFKWEDGYYLIHIINSTKVNKSRLIKELDQIGMQGIYAKGGSLVMVYPKSGEVMKAWWQKVLTLRNSDDTRYRRSYPQMDLHRAKYLSSTMGI